MMRSTVLSFTLQLGFPVLAVMLGAVLLYCMLSVVELNVVVLKVTAPVHQMK